MEVEGSGKASRQRSHEGAGPPAVPRRGIISVVRCAVENRDGNVHGIGRAECARAFVVERESESEVVLHGPGEACGLRHSMR